MNYIFELGSILYFRRKVPLELRDALGINEIRRSLHTKKMDDAKAISANINQKLEKVFVAVASGLPVDTILQMIGLKIRKKRKPSDGRGLISSLYKQFSDEMVSTKQWNEKTVHGNQIAFNLYLSLMGDKPVNEITHASLMEFRGMIQRLPPNSTKAKATRDQNLRELIKKSHKRTLTATRVNHILFPLTGLWKWLQKHEIIKENPAHNLLLPKIAARPDEQRKRYSNDEVRQILDEVKEFKDTQPERFWVPLIAAYSGMRVNEISQLYLSDIQEIDKIWCFSVTDNKDKRLKNLSSRRIIPIHPCLQGILKYANDLHQHKKERLFPGLRKHRRNGYGHQIISWWSRWKSRISTDKKLSFHSLRHTACDEMKQAKVDPAIIAELMGHRIGSISMERYGKRFSSLILLEAIKKIDYNI